MRLLLLLFCFVCFSIGVCSGGGRRDREPAPSTDPALFPHCPTPGRPPPSRPAQEAGAAFPLPLIMIFLVIFLFSFSCFSFQDLDSFRNFKEFPIPSISISFFHFSGISISKGSSKVKLKTKIRVQRAKHTHMACHHTMALEQLERSPLPARLCSCLSGSKGVQNTIKKS